MRSFFLRNESNESNFTCGCNTHTRARKNWRRKKPNLNCGISILILGNLNGQYKKKQITYLNDKSDLCQIIEVKKSALLKTLF